MWREKVNGRKKRENNTLYYFVGLYVKIKNWDVGWVVKWVSKINKIVFEDAK